MKFPKKKAKVCFVVWGAEPVFKSKRKLKYGGAEYQVSLWIRSLSEYYKVTLINNKYSRAGGGVLTKIINKYLFLKKLKNLNADVYVNRVGDVNTLITSLFCKLNRKKFVFMVSHDWECDLKFFNKSLIKRCCFWLGLKLADSITVQSENQDRMIKDRLGPKTAIIRNIVNLDLFSKGIESEEKWIVWVGRLVPWKRPELFLDLANKFSQEKFIMVGLSDRSNPVFAKRVANAARKIQNMKFVPGLSWEEVNTLIAKSKFLVNTSESEGFPNTFLQSAVLDKPVLSFQVDPDGFINKNKFGYCAESSIKKYYDLAARLISKEKDRKLMGRRFKNFVLKNHNKDVNTQKMRQLIDDLLIGQD